MPDDNVRFGADAGSYLQTIKSMVASHFQLDESLTKVKSSTVEAVKVGEDWAHAIQRQVVNLRAGLEAIVQFNEKEDILGVTLRDTTEALREQFIAQQGNARAAQETAMALAEEKARAEELASLRTNIKGRLGDGPEQQRKAEENRRKELAGIRKEQAAAIDAEHAKRRAVESTEIDKRQQRQRTRQQQLSQEQRELGAIRKRQAAERDAHFAARRDANAASQERFIAAQRTLRQQQLQRAQLMILTALEYERAQAAATFVNATGRVIPNMRQMEKHSMGMYFSFKGMVRLLTVQLAHQAISALVSSLREGVRTSVELQRRVGEIMTISQSSPMSNSSWVSGLRGLSSQYGMDILEQAEAAYQILSNQVAKGAEALEFLARANVLSAVAVSNNRDSVLALTGVLNAFKLSVVETDEVAAALFRTVELGRLRLEELKDVGDVGLLASQLGASYQELLATQATLTIQGIQLSKANTQLRGIFIKLLKPTSEMKKFFDDIGVSSGEMAVQAYGLAGVLELLHERTKGSSSELAKYINRIRGISGAFALSGQGMEIYKSNLDKITNSQEAYGEATAITFENAAKKADIAWQTIKNFFRVDIGNALLVGLAESTNSFEDIKQIFIELRPLAQDIVSGIIEWANWGFDLLSDYKVIFMEVRGFASFLIDWFNAVVNTPGFKQLFGLWKFVMTFTTGGYGIIKLLAAFGRATGNIQGAEKQLNVVKETAKYLAEIRVSQKDRVESTNKTLQRDMAELVATSNELYKAQTKAFVTDNDKWVNGIESVTEAVKKQISYLKKQIDELKGRIKDYYSDVTNVIQQTQAKLVDLSLHRKSQPQQLKILQARISQLMGQAGAAAAVGDLDKFKNIWKEINSRQEKYDQLRLKRGFSIRKAQQARINMTNIYLRQRHQIAVLDNNRLVSAEKFHKSRKDALKEYQDVLKKIKDTKLEDGANLTGFDNITKFFNSYRDLINKAASIEATFGMTSGRTQEYADLRRQARDLETKALERSHIHDLRQAAITATQALNVREKNMETFNAQLGAANKAFEDLSKIINNLNQQLINSPGAQPVPLPSGGVKTSANTNVGDIHVHVALNGDNLDYDADQLGRALERGVKQGKYNLGVA